MTPPLPLLLRQRWFLWPLALRAAVWLFLGHAYEMAVFQDASWQMAAGQGVYARFAPWLASAGDGYYAAPPPYAFMLWISGALAGALGGHWWFHQLLIKGWLLLADLAVMAYLLRRHPGAARRYWTLWFVPVVGIGQVQPDLWAGLGVVAAFNLAGSGRWLAAGLTLGAAGAVKPVPLVILPFLLVHLFRRAEPRAAARFAGGVLAALAAGWLPYAALFPDAAHVADVVRFHAERPIAGATIPAGLLMLANASLAVVELSGGALPRAAAAYEAAVRASAAFPAVTLGVFGALLAAAVLGRRWSLPQSFCLPLAAFLAANKVVHEHYVLVALPLWLAAGINLRGAIWAFSVYLLAAGSPLRYVPGQYGVPTGVEAWLPPPIGLAAALVFAAVAGCAAVAFGAQMVGLAARLGRREPAATTAR